MRRGPFFSKWLKFDLDVSKWKFSAGEKSISRQGKNEERTFFFFLLFCFSLFKTAKISFGCIKMEIFYREKKHFTPGKKSGKMTLPLQKNFPVMPLGSPIARDNQFLAQTTMHYRSSA